MPCFCLHFSIHAFEVRIISFPEFATASMLVFMRALPGRESRAPLDAPLAVVTRSSAHLDQRRRILRAVGELVAKRGYADVTVELVVKRAHVSFKTFYKHFPGKEAAFLALFDGTLAVAEKTVRQRLEAEPLSWADQVVLALRTVTELILSEPLIARAVIVEAPTVGPGILERYERATKAFVPLFRAGRELSPRGDELPATIEDTLAGSVFWSAYQRLIVGEAERLPELLPEITEMVLRTYLGQAEAGRIARVTAGQQPAAA
jgi:AcrR family transcriptional regulator